MKIAILSRNSNLYSTNRLREAAVERGHDARVVDYLRCYMNITAHRPQIIYQGSELEGFDAIVPRIGASHTFYGTAVVRQFEMMKVFSVNGSQAISRSRDKLRSLQLLSQGGIGLPVTGFAHSTVSKVLWRAGLSRPAKAAREPANRYEWPCPGDLLHMDVSEYARFQRPGHRVTGDRSSQDRQHRDGVDYVHAIVDDHSRLAYAEIHPDQRAHTVAGFLERALSFYARHGITVKRLMTDNA